MAFSYSTKIKAILGIGQDFPHAKAISNTRQELGEGTLWDDREQVLWWVDINAQKLYRYDPQTAEERLYDLGSAIGTVGLRESGGLIVALADGFAFFDPNTEKLEQIADPESHLPGNRFNDGKPGPNGSFYAGTMGYYSEKNAGALYRLDPDKTVQPILSNITISNGMAWNAAEDTMFYIDTPTRQIMAFDYDKSSGEIANGRPAIKIPYGVGYPDGMTIDSEDKLWVAHFNGNGVYRWDPANGRFMESIALPATNITCCTFGGANLDTLYIATARIMLSEKHLSGEPMAGALLEVQTAYTGREAYRFTG